MPRRLLTLVLLVVLFLSLGSGVAAAESDEETYFRTIVVLLIESNVHLNNASGALSDCTLNFTGCINDPIPVVNRLNASRTSLIEVSADVAALPVPERYRRVQDLSVAGLTDSVDGLALHMDGLRNQSLETFQAGSAHMSDGRAELGEAADILSATPPRSVFDQALPLLVIAGGVSGAVVVALFLRWRSRATRKRTPPPDEKGT